MMADRRLWTCSHTRALTHINVRFFFSRCSLLELLLVGLGPITRERLEQMFHMLDGLAVGQRYQVQPLNSVLTVIKALKALKMRSVRNQGAVQLASD